jgi:hypothetical protein
MVVHVGRDGVIRSAGGIGAGDDIGIPSEAHRRLLDLSPDLSRLAALGETSGLATNVASTPRDAVGPVAIKHPW